jgi:hypothetical protein
MHSNSITWRAEHPPFVIARFMRATHLSFRHRVMTEKGNGNEVITKKGTATGIAHTCAEITRNRSTTEVALLFQNKKVNTRSISFCINALERNIRKDVVVLFQH